MRRITAALAFAGALAWCCLLFGIGLNDLTNRHTTPGVIFAVVVLPLLIGGLLYGIWRVLPSSARTAGVMAFVQNQTPAAAAQGFDSDGNRESFTRRSSRNVLGPRQSAELQGERVVFRSLEQEGFLERFRYRRILEIGPKHGEDSLLLATLEPTELVLIDLPEKRKLVQTWLPALRESCPIRYVEDNLLFIPPDELRALGQFDLIWCLGVIYHNAEQLRLLRRLFNLCAMGGALVLESSTTRDRRLTELNVVEIHWPEPYRGSRNITHHPSRLALKSWLEMVGFSEVEIRDIYSDGVSWQRAALTAVRPTDPRPHILHVSDDGPGWIVGEAR